MDYKNTQILILPGLGGSGKDHWQSFWLKEFKNATNDKILQLDSPIVLVAHSLAVSLVIHWAKKYKNPNIKGALLVAPADVDSPSHTPDVVRDFSAMPTSKLSFPSIVVASENDDFVSLDRAKYFSEQWESDFINLGLKGHINSDSNLKSWKEGQLILEKLLKKVNV